VAVTKLTNEDRSAMIEQFHERVAQGLPVDDAWRKKMWASGVPRLPDNPSAAQLDAWVELSELVADPTFAESLRNSAKLAQAQNIDVDRLRIANEQVAAAASAARARNVSTESDEAKRIVRDYIEAVARAAGRSPDDAFARHFRARFAAHDTRASRYRELLAIMNNEPSSTGTTEDWTFIAEAVKLHTPA
jgi:hypothetical protein